MRRKTRGEEPDTTTCLFLPTLVVLLNLVHVVQNEDRKIREMRLVWPASRLSPESNITKSF